jgi:hypothetical protein
MNEAIDWGSPERARSKGLDYVPRTPSATASCDALGDVLAATECRKNGRTSAGVTESRPSTGPQGLWLLTYRKQG